MTQLVWLRSDLRVHDNPALTSAMDQGSTIAVYCVTEKQWDRHHVSPAKRALILGQLKALERDLAELNVPLRILNCETFAALPAALAGLAGAFQCSQVHANIEYELNELKCASEVEKKLTQQDCTLRQYHDQCAVTPGDVRTQQGDMYKVFTAFKKEYQRQYECKARQLAASPSAQKPIDVASNLEDLPEASEAAFDNTRWPVSEEAAHDALNEFIEECVRDYADDRDFPAKSATSALSPYLAVGMLSSRQCLQAALSVNEGRLQSGRKGIDTWITELIWRDFYRHLLYAYPDLCRHKPFKHDTDELPWRHDEEMFNAWCEGRTGYPIVDAAMRQLNETAWMHNRLRMITAMFLTKHLFIDWRWGERYFMEQLIDGDLASNNGGWQWSASTGVDAAPYFRIFNPTRQSERFDPDGAFIKRYVPELKEVPAKDIHEPNAEQRKAAGYPKPMVDHAEAVAQTKTWFKELNA